MSCFNEEEYIVEERASYESELSFINRVKWVVIAAAFVVGMMFGAVIKAEVRTLYFLNLYFYDQPDQTLISWSYEGCFEALKQYTALDEVRWAECSVEPNRAVLGKRL
jgi:hypothetical protein